MLLNNLHINYYLRSSKTEVKKGILYCRVKVGGTILLTSVTNVKLNANEWDQKKQRPKTNAENGVVCLMFINEINKILNQIHLEYEAKGKVLTKSEVRAALKGADHIANGVITKHPTYLNIFDSFLTDMKKTIGTGVGLSTYEQYRGYRRNANEILEKQDLHETPIRNLSGEDILNFQKLATLRWAKSTVIKMMPTIKKIFDYAVDMRLIAENPARNIKRLKIAEGEKTIPFWLEPSQLKQFSDIELDERKSRYRDAFVFCCWTGLAIGDYLLMNPEDREAKVAAKQAVNKIEPGTLIESEGVYILKGRRQKTGTSFRVPLLPEPLRIISKYGGKLENLPFDLLSKDVGKIINEVAGLVGVKKQITFHTARKTMANYLLNVRMINPVYVLEIMGWKSIEEANAYVVVQESSLIRALFGDRQPGEITSAAADHKVKRIATYVSEVRNA
ncbi:tyrosine-type recombinase/integrase [Dyadobacter sp. CY351]|uniref:tyrosine-type recombinase/integrase n=1 Tax=Dyadobacter sp. CY351 TaxID=2909337 RepID=UPI001F38A5A5|nr:tyrosine-type recombinase/integrase [Dyadobacter sp. CY351]MCF2517142.1 tyrosine-type recombinase/integrase [Dyadobacter sp. CY351]